jgi:hypothetical protein
MIQNRTYKRTIGSVCICGRRHNEADLAALPDWQHHDALPHTLVERRIARRLIRHVRANGCKHIRVWSEGEQLQDGQHENDILRAIVHVVDECAIELLGEAEQIPMETAQGPAVRRRKRLTRILWVGGNGEDAISDYTTTPWTASVLDPFIDQLIEAGLNLSGRAELERE